MGQTVAEVASNHGDIEIVAGVDLSVNPHTKFPVFNSFEMVNCLADVAIDFSNPKLLTSILDYALNSKVPLVLCTTGYSDEQISQIEEASKQIPIFKSGNMSIGISFIIETVNRALSVLGPDFDIEIVEKHHNKKIDAPSGTALMIAENINKHNGGKMVYEFERHSHLKPRGKNEIGIHSIRGGNIVGDHDVMFIGSEESITISHSAKSRNIFAEGALKAARFIKDKNLGLYGMEDMLKKTSHTVK